MRIRRCASRLLGVAVSVPAPPRFVLPPLSPCRFELPPPPAHESHAGVASKTSSSGELCPTCFNPVDLMNQLDLSDPQEEERFVEKFSVPLVRRASWIFPAITPACSIKEDEHIAVEMVDGVNAELHLAEKKTKAAIKTARKKDEIKPKTKKGKEKAEESDADDAGGAGVWTCKKNDGNRFCRRPVSQPDSFCPEHADLKLPDISKPRRKRVSAFGNTVNEGFLFYDGIVPSRSKRQHRGSSSRGVPEHPPAEEKEEAQLPEEHIDATPTEAQVGAADGVHRIAGLDEEISNDDEDALGCNGESARKVKTRIKISPVGKRWRKRRVKSRSINSLM